MLSEIIMGVLEVPQRVHTRSFGVHEGVRVIPCMQARADSAQRQVQRPTGVFHMLFRTDVLWPWGALPWTHLVGLPPGKVGCCEFARARPVAIMPTPASSMANSPSFSMKQM